MRKHLLLGIGLLGFAVAGNAQIIWSDNFNDEDISDWTLTDVDGDEFNWGDTFTILGENEEPITPVSLISRSWAGAPLTPNNWAVSPMFSLSSVSGAVTLTWHQEVSDQFPGEKYTVYAGTTSDIAELVTSDVSFTITPTAANAITDLSLDLSSLAGEETVYIAFRHYDSTDKDYLSIDDVTVTAGTAGINENLASQFSVYPNPANNMVNIKAPNNIVINEVAVVDVNGRTVKAIKGSADNQINISELASGVYVMNIVSDAGSISKKIVKN